MSNFNREQIYFPTIRCIATNNEFNKTKVVGKQLRSKLLHQNVTRAHDTQ